MFLLLFDPEDMAPVFVKIVICQRSVTAWWRASPLHSRVPKFESLFRLSCMEFALVGFIQALRLPPTVKKQAWLFVPVWSYDWQVTHPGCNHVLCAFSHMTAGYTPAVLVLSLNFHALGLAFISVSFMTLFSAEPYLVLLCLLVLHSADYCTLFSCDYCAKCKYVLVFFVLCQILSLLFVSSQFSACSALCVLLFGFLKCLFYLRSCLLNLRLHVPAQ